METSSGTIHALFAMINDDMNQPVADWAGRRTDPQCDMNMSSKQGGYIKFLNWYQEKKLWPLFVQGTD